MFDISWAKLLVIAVVALIFIGPRELPEMLHTLGRTLGKLRRTADDFRRQFEDSMKDAGYQDLAKNLHDFKQLNPATQLKASIEKAMSDDPQPNASAGHVTSAATDTAAANTIAAPESSASTTPGTTDAPVSPSIDKAPVGEHQEVTQVTDADRPKPAMANGAAHNGSSFPPAA